MDSQSKSAIYQIRNLVNGKLYVGSAINHRRRKIEHWRDLRAGDHSSRKLQAAWKKYGEDAFIFEVLEPVGDVTQLITREQDWMDRLGVYKNGYNCTPTAGSLLGKKMSAGTREKMSKARIGKKLSPETVAKMKVALTGRSMTPEQCQKMRDAKLGKSRGPHSEETRKKMSAAAVGRTFSAEHRAKLALAKTGKPWSEARRAASRSTA